MPGRFANATPEERAEWTRKANETKARKAEEKRQRQGQGAARVSRGDAKPGRRLPITKIQVQHGVRALVIGVDAGLAYLIPSGWVTDPDPNLSDRLNGKEIEILTEAFSDEAMKHPRVLRFLANLTSFTDRLGIAGALIIVALPRLARRGMVPTFLIPIVRDLIGTATEAEMPATPEPAVEEPGPDREAA